jgi:hypothetical protein
VLPFLECAWGCIDSQRPWLLSACVLGTIMVPLCNGAGMAVCARQCTMAAVQQPWPVAVMHERV